MRGGVRDRELLLDVIPECRLLAEGDREPLWRERSGWIFKAVDRFGSRGVLVGDKMTRGRFDQLEPATTLAQRLVSELLLWDEPPSVLRNLRERLLAAQMVSRFGRARVLEWYLNSAYYGEWIDGADAAAQVYFGKPAAALTSAEAPLLAARTPARAAKRSSGVQRVPEF